MSDELTPDQVSYCRELADARRAIWKAHARDMTEAERKRMEDATKQIDAEVEAILVTRARRRIITVSGPEASGDQSLPKVKRPS